MDILNLIRNKFEFDIHVNYRLLFDKLLLQLEF